MTNTMHLWQQARTALFVLRGGTISAAAKALGVHRATVIRHVDELEEHLNTTLFQRHGKGYTPTEAGLRFKQVAETTEQDFNQLANELECHKHKLSGTLIVTSLPGLEELAVPALVELQRQHPAIDIELLSSERVFQMQFGEAHVAIRAGSQPQDADNIVIPFMSIETGLYGHPAYLEQYGTPNTYKDLAQHRLIGLQKDYHRVPFMAWLNQQQLSERVSFQANSSTSLHSAVNSGAGLAFLPTIVAKAYPALVQVLPPIAEWQSTSWIVTHKDMHRSPKVQTFLEILNEMTPFRQA